ncbi:Baculoviral IAP repeat-containing protein 7 [Saguinus oedipus]|uniref:RING-type E3 ubiquitin transferase n=1 Tax=Saguinus oedipus TaxID=9490 RepID=A0ABQ9VME1_SAGOE|nr:Baculoviral IAP repeat-containing protein 7 [Saguinus oedipus]
MGPEDNAKCLHCGPEPSPEEHRGPRTLCCPVRGLDTCRAWDHVDGQILGQLRPLAEEEEEEGAGATSPRGPAFPGMGSEELRLASFYDWPLTAGVPPELLAAAGFFHTGQQDKVRCFFCYGGLQSWKRGDDPWTEHAKWFPRYWLLPAP